MIQPPQPTDLQWIEGIIPDLEQTFGVQPLPSAQQLHVSIAPDGASFKIGTCEHCVLEEGRPDRAWNADGDKDLDFDRDRYLTLLARLGIVCEARQAYICP